MPAGRHWSCAHRLWSTLLGIGVPHCRRPITTGPSRPHQIGFGLGSVWVSAGNAGTVVRIDPANNEIQAAIPVPAGVSACSGFAIGTAVWMPSCADSLRMARIDLVSNTAAASIFLSGYGGDPIFIDDAPWLTVNKTDQPGDEATILVRVNPATNQIDRRISLDPIYSNSNLVVAEGYVWLADYANDRLVRIPLSALTP